MLKSINVFERSIKYEGEFYAELVYSKGDHEKVAEVVILSLASLRQLAESNGAALEIYVSRDEDFVEPYQLKPHRKSYG